MAPPRINANAVTAPFVPSDVVAFQGGASQRQPNIATPPAVDLAAHRAQLRALLGDSLPRLNGAYFSAVTGDPSQKVAQYAAHLANQALLAAGELLINSDSDDVETPRSDLPHAETSGIG